VLDVIPKLVVRQLLAPALALEQPVRLICREDKWDRLLADLAARRTDMVLSDAPIGTAVQVQGFNHLLGESGVSFFASPAVAARLKKGVSEVAERRRPAPADRSHRGAALAQPVV
jgi:LysR family transcriptional activator of nhaA